MAWIVNRRNDDEYSSFSVFSGEKMLYNLKFQTLFLFTSVEYTSVILKSSQGWKKYKM